MSFLQAFDIYEVEIDDIDEVTDGIVSSNGFIDIELLSWGII